MFIFQREEKKDLVYGKASSRIGVGGSSVVFFKNLFYFRDKKIEKKENSRLSAFVHKTRLSECAN